MNKSLFLRITLYFIFFVSFITISCNSSKKSVSTDFNFKISNPLDVKFGDPYVLNNGSGTFYMYGTGGGAKDGFSVYSSKNLNDWKYENQVFFGNTPDTWSISDFWAPECYKIGDKYFLFYSANWKVNPTKEVENFHIGVAVSDKPTGPFVDIKNEPLFEPGYPILDANVFQDTDGNFYLYYSRACYKHAVKTEFSDWAKKEGLYPEIEESWVYGVALKPDFTGVIGEPVLLLRPPVKLDDKNSEWESRTVKAKEANRRWTEGSTTFKKDDTYYMTYSANHYAGEHYAVGFATANSPLGPYTKSTSNPILQKDTQDGGNVTGTGHNSILFLPNDKMYMVYHGRTTQTGDDRVVFINEMKITKDKVLIVETTSANNQKK